MRRVLIEPSKGCSHGNIAQVPRWTFNRHQSPFKLQDEDRPRWKWGLDDLGPSQLNRLLRSLEFLLLPVFLFTSPIG